MSSVLLSSPSGVQRLDDLLDALVHREERFQLAAVPALQVADVTRGQAREVPDLGRFVGDVGLVEVRRPGQRLGVRTRVAWRGAGTADALAVARRVRALAVRDVRRRVGEPQEERLRPRRPAVDEVHGFPGEHVLLVVSGILAVLDQVAVVVDGVVVDPLVVGGSGLPLRPACRYTGLVRVAVQVLADHGGVVAGVAQPDGEVVGPVQLLKAVGAAAGPLLPNTRWLCMYWPVRKVAREGQQSE